MLPSQTTRSVSRRRGRVSKRSRKRRGGPPIGKIITFGIIVAGGWWAAQTFLFSDNSTNAATTGDGVSVSTDDLAAATGDDAANGGTASGDKSMRIVADRSRGVSGKSAQQTSDDDTTNQLIMGGVNEEPAWKTQAASAQDRAQVGSATDNANDQTRQVESNAQRETDNRSVASRDSTQGGSQRTSQRLQKGFDLIAVNKLIEARLMLSRALASGELSADEAMRARSELAAINDRVVFGPEIFPDDDYTHTYVIQGGDVLERIVRKQGLQVDWRFIQRINRISNPRNIRGGDRLKLITGPFHAVVDKSDYALDLYLGEGDSQVYVTTLRVGHGEYNSTPIGLFRVRPRSKMINPSWRNPRTGERFTADNPENPIGEHWIGLEGVSEAVRDASSLGIHGTIDPDSIGQQVSMGCIRLAAADIELVYEMLIEGVSTVRIQD